MEDLVQATAEPDQPPCDHPVPEKMQMHEQWQIEQGRRCGCRGADEWCGCQNINQEAELEKITETIKFNFNNEDQQKCFHERLAGESPAEEDLGIRLRFFALEKAVSTYAGVSSHVDVLNAAREYEAFLCGSSTNAIIR
jgi:hypothetical protein